MKSIVDARFYASPDSSRMRAAILRKIPSAALDVTEWDRPSPGQDELLVRVLACGICGTDLHILEGASYRPELPFVLGHEPVGTVVAVGSRADAGLIGTTVTATLFVGCGSCSECGEGDERVCAQLQGITGVLGRGGGFAEYLIIRASQAVPVPPALTPTEAATLVDAGATAANSVRAIEDMDPEGLVVVVGGGPVGFFAAELLRVTSRRCVVVQPSEGRRRALLDLGHAVLASLDDIVDRPAVVIDCAAAPGTVGWALEHLGPRGRLIAAAYGPADANSLAPLARKELRLVGIRSGARRDIEWVLALAASRAIATPAVSQWRLAEINAALRALREKRVPGKAVIVP